jgi:hypothetical protein
LLTSNLLKPEELLDRIDAGEAVEALRAPLVESVDEISRDLAEQIRPGLGIRCLRPRAKPSRPGSRLRHPG